MSCFIAQFGNGFEIAGVNEKQGRAQFVAIVRYAAPNQPIARAKAKHPKLVPQQIKQEIIQPGLLLRTDVLTGMSGG